MIQFFSKARSGTQFKARSSGREVEADQARALSVLRAIDEALDAAKAEHAGLTTRIDDVLARAAVTMGNDSDEYLTRDPQDSRHQDLMGTEIANGQRRLSELAVSIGHFQFLKTALLTRFPDLNLSKMAKDNKTS
jgi:hypothetical protein